MSTTPSQDEVVYVVDDRDKKSSMNTILYSMLSLLLIGIIVAIICNVCKKRSSYVYVPAQNVTTKTMDPPTYPNSNNLVGGSSKILNSFSSESPLSFYTY